MKEIKIKNALELYAVRKPRACRVKKSGSVDAGNGLDCVFVDDRDIKALQKGELLYFTDGEYAHLIAYMGVGE